MARIIALLTDFGSQDGYAGIMEGVMLSVNPDIKVVTISNGISPFNILSAAYVLYTAWDYFPEDTIFLSVIDPGVGSDRKILLAECDNKYLLTPDNGTVSILNRMKDNIQYYRLPEHTLQEVVISDSNTFHGRDIFSPLAVNLATYGISILTKKEKTLPVIIDNCVPMISNNKLKGKIIHIDRFGNCITSIHRKDIESHFGSLSLEIYACTSIIQGISRTYSDVSPNAPLCYIGSSGFLEIAVREGNAQKTLRLKENYEIVVKISNK